MPTGRIGTSSSPLTAAGEQIHQSFAGFQPAGPTDMIGFFDGLPGFWEGFATDMGTLGAKADDQFPLDPSVAEGIREMAAQMAGLRDQAEELRRRFRTAHEVEIARIEQPRAGEATWDVSADR